LVFEIEQFIFEYSRSTNSDQKEGTDQKKERDQKEGTDQKKERDQKENDQKGATLVKSRLTFVFVPKDV
jgi:hypothetical protein